MNITIWNKITYQEYLNYLKNLNNPKYQEFQKSICFTKYEILGIKIPLLRQIAKSIAKTNIIDFLNLCESNYYEEVLIEGLVIALLKDEEIFDQYFIKYLEKIDNWAICDTFCNSIKIVSKNPSKYFKIATKLTKSKQEFTCRVGLIMILNFFIKKEYLKSIYNILDSIVSNKYYINMAQAWLICELYINYEQETVNYLQSNRLNDFTQNKAISKIRDSYRVSQAQKDYLNTLKRV